MSLIWCYATGRFASAESELHRALGQYARNADYIKVGRTNDPERRWKEHQSERRRDNDSWSWMVVIFEADTFLEAVKAEKQLIAYAQRERKRGEYVADVWNDRAGDDIAEAETQYLYILTDSRGEPESEPLWLYSTGRYSEVATSLKRAVGQYARREDYIKIGRTNAPARRWREHQAERRRNKDNWQRMVVIYATSSFKSVSLAEKEMIDHAKNAGYKAEVWNDISGSDKGRPTVNYVYVLLD